MAIALAAIRRAAAKLVAEKKFVTAAHLAKILGKDVAEVSSYLLKVDGLKEEIGFESHSTLVRGAFTRYAEAAGRVKERDQSVTLQTLATEAGTTSKALAVWLKRHPDAKLAFNLVSRGEASRMMRAKAYEAAAAKLRSEGKKVSVDTIAKALGQDHAVIYKDVGHNSDLSKIWNGS